jgi:hypothetical protein
MAACQPTNLSLNTSIPPVGASPAGDGGLPADQSLEVKQPYVGAAAGCDLLICFGFGFGF